MKNDRLAWPILLLLLTVLVPSVGMVWMMREAVRNERAASDQRLKDAYQVQLQSASDSMIQQWSRGLQVMPNPLDETHAAAVFANLVRQGNADSVLICDADGQVVYPSAVNWDSLMSYDPSPQWKHAEQLEFEAKEIVAAAKAYGAISTEHSDPLELARARQAQVRCFLRLGKTDLAIDGLQQQRQQDDVRDVDGRSFAAAAELRLLELLDQESDDWNEVANQLVRRLGDYEAPVMTAPQRRFLMAQFDRVVQGAIALPMQDAETLAAEAVAANINELATASLQATQLPDVWCQTSANGRIVHLLRTATVHQRLQEIANDVPLPSGVMVSLHSPNDRNRSFIDWSLGESMGDWRLAISMTRDDVRRQASQQRNAWHVWIACLIVAVTLCLSWLLTRMIRQQLRLSQLKNSLVATVSHELKTPLASIRLLVDTLLDSDPDSDDGKSPNQTREYLQLISHENARLTRLIDGFLTFSRIEGGMQSFDFQRINLRDVAQQAAAVFQEHHESANTCLRKIVGDSCWVLGDTDLLVTAVVNLLENAWKYSEQDRLITLTTDAQDGQAMISVADNGIGMRPQNAKHVFDRFYQVDQRVARNRGGCGLGLSIVRAIIDSHDGTAHVESQSGIGSTFTILLPKLDLDQANIERVSQRENRT